MLNPTPSTSIPLIRDGRMRALAITSPARIAELPEVPTAREAGLPDLTLEFWARYVHAGVSTLFGGNQSSIPNTNLSM